MLKAFLDASWSDDLIVVGGVVSPQELWTNFEHSWRAMLDRFGIEYRFHATEYWARKGEFMRMRESDHVALGKEIRRLLAEHKPLSFACVLAKDAYQQWRRKQHSHHLKDGTYYALDWCLTVLIHRINQYPADEGVEIVCDQGDGREKISRDIADWKTEQLREHAWRFPGHPDPNRAVTFEFGSSKEIVQLQAADIVVHTTLKWSEAYLRGEDPNHVPFSQEMQGMMMLHPLFTLEDIELFHRIELENVERLKENMARKP
ncbi:DUF3800 domain-containing protein [Bradyrhizobium sp. SZCCHNS3052]|uniref:DUF3800 domain-containing protein n=1 Tax=Bradyrhizobium sp. SZCCHNS3052 TaxID=3057321 RepID=UPI002916ABAE|nr:DUF3800 domain-containing protein [Bradyrhizobium sp. SZCCHNS3052]